MHHLEFLPCPADPDTWMNNMFRPRDGFNYYTYVLIYVDDLMVIHHGAESLFIRIDNYFSSIPARLVTLTSNWGPI